MGKFKEITEEETNKLFKDLEEGKFNEDMLKIDPNKYMKKPFSYRTTIFHTLVKKGHIELLSKLLAYITSNDVFVRRISSCQPILVRGENKTIPYIMDNLGRGLLYEAACAGHTEIIDYLIKTYNLNSKVVDEFGEGLLHAAANGGQNETIDHLVKTYGLDPKALDSFRRGLLHAAAFKGHNKTIDHLIKTYKLDEKALDEYEGGLLHAAAAGGQNGTIDHLVKTYDLVPKAVDNHRNGLLYEATYRGRNETVAFLIDTYKLDPKAVNNDGETLLHAAAHGGHNETIALLIDKYKLDPKAVTNNGETLLDFADRLGQTETVEFLKEKYKLDKKPGVGQLNQYLMGLISSGPSKELCQAIFLENEQGHTPIHEAINSGALPLVEYMVYVLKLNNMFIDKHTNEGAGFLHVAASAGQVEMIDYLIREVNIKFSYDNNGQSALHYAAKAGKVDAAAHLISVYKRYANEKDYSGRTILDLCPENTREELRRKLEDLKVIEPAQNGLVDTISQPLEKNRDFTSAKPIGENKGSKADLENEKKNPEMKI